jgi:hypothetical protein
LTKHGEVLEGDRDVAATVGQFGVRYDSGWGQHPEHGLFCALFKAVINILVIRLKLDGDPADFYRIGSSLVSALTA